MGGMDSVWEQEKPKDTLSEMLVNCAGSPHTQYTLCYALYDRKTR